MAVFFGLVLLAAVCALMAVRAVRLLHAALWLAGVSVAVALMLYLVGAYVMAVIELSLSVGLITILLVFAISMVGADSPDRPVPRLLNLPFVAAMLLLVIGLTVPLLASQSRPTEASFAVTFWQQREADVLAQVALIFAGVLGLLGLLTESRSHRPPSRANAPQAAETQPAAAAAEGETELEKV
ncbi:MAG: NADH-quinone oxidoreductase subunit J [Anaerolineae bacterium]|nr:NADH-quinone oxidoreductase subunit J [Anaerolineae bacterium]